MTLPKLRALIAAKSAPVICRKRRRSKNIVGFHVTGPDGQHHLATDFKEAVNNLAVRVECWSSDRWTIRPKWKFEPTK